MDEKYKFGAEAVAEVRCRNGEVFGYIGSRVLRDMLPLGTQLYTTPQPDRVAELEAENESLRNALARDTAKYINKRLELEATNKKLLDAINKIQALPRYFLCDAGKSELVINAYDVGQAIAPSFHYRNKALEAIENQAEYEIVGIYSPAKIRRDINGEVVIYDAEKPTLNIIEKNDNL